VIDDKTPFLKKESGVFCWGGVSWIGGKKYDLTPLLKSYELREPSVSYGADFTPENGLLRHQNSYYWNFNS